jgi:hypothetical protein
VSVAGDGRRKVAEERGSAVRGCSATGEDLGS